MRIDGQKPSTLAGGQPPASGSPTQPGPPSSNLRPHKRSLDRHIYARDAAADAYADALAVFDNAIEMEVQRRDALAFADPEIFVSEGEFDYYY